MLRKVALYIIISLLSLSLIIDIYSFVHHAFIRSAVAVIVNIATPIFALIYVVIVLNEKKRLKKKLNDQTIRFFSKN
jgi:hypothetical protein